MGRVDSGAWENYVEGTRQTDSVTSGEGVLHLGTRLYEVTQNRGERLLNKSTGLCKVVRRSIGSDACPVLEG